MQAAFPIVVFGAVGLSIVMSIVFLITKGSGSAYDEIGAGGLEEREETSPGEWGATGVAAGAGGPTDGADSLARGAASGWMGQGAGHPGAGLGGLGAEGEREREIRQMVQARSERRVRRGEAPLDVEAEVAQLLATEPTHATHDAGIAEEVLQLVVARNERRERQGLEPLDIEAEVQRTLAELGP